MQNRFEAYLIRIKKYCLCFAFSFFDHKNESLNF